MVGDFLAVGPCLLTDDQTKALSGINCTGGHNALEDAIREGFIDIDGISNNDDYRHGKLITPGVHSGTHRPVDFNDKTPSSEQTPDSLLVRTSQGVELSSPRNADPLPVNTAKHAENTGPFSQDPSNLEGKPIDDLNLMIIGELPEDEQETFEPYTESKEAIAHLSLNWKKPE